MSDITYNKQCENNNLLNWNELKAKGIKPLARNILRATALCPAMLTSIGHKAHIKVEGESSNIQYFQIVRFDKSFILAKLQSEVLNPLGLKNLQELTNILEAKGNSDGDDNTEQI